MAHPGFAKRLTDGGSAAGFIAASKRGEAFKASVETGGAHADGKPRKRSGRSVNGKDGGGRLKEAWCVKASRNPQEAAPASLSRPRNPPKPPPHPLRFPPATA